MTLVQFFGLFLYLFYPLGSVQPKCTALCASVHMRRMPQTLVERQGCDGSQRIFLSYNSSFLF